MIKLILTALITLLAFTSCDKKTALKGNFYCKECAYLKKLSIDDEIVDFGLLGSGSYNIKNNNLYVKLYGTTAKFEIIDKNTLKSINTIGIQQEIYRRVK